MYPKILKDYLTELVLNKCFLINWKNESPLLAQIIY